MSTIYGAVQKTQTNGASTELSHINEEIYKKNIELAEKNKVLSLLRQIYEIVLGAVTDPKNISEQVARLIVHEIGFRGVGIFLVEKSMLNNIGMEMSGISPEYEKKLSAICRDNELSLLNNKGNLLVSAINEKTKKTTKYLFDALNPMTDLNTASLIQSNLNIRTTAIFPLIVRGQLLGALMILLSEDLESITGTKVDIMDRLTEVIGVAIDNALLYREIQTANIKLKELDKLKDEFVSIASHELRTPMTIVRSYLWMLMQAQNGTLNEKQKIYVDRAYGSTVRLITLINDMLDTSRIDSGRVSLDLQPIDLGKLSQDVIAETKTRAEQLGLSLNVEARVVPTVIADGEKIREVLINLIGNSMKFTPKGGSISIKFEVGEDSVTTKVVDTGMGFTKEYEAKLFQKFGFINTSYQMNKSDNGGTGLGLYICKSILEMHGGTIQAMSPGPGKGAVFSFSLKKQSETK